MRLVLASGSPRRAVLLTQLDLEYEVHPSDIDESPRPGEPPAGYVERLAREKAVAGCVPGVVTVAADTAVAHEGHVMGKPAHPQEARSMLVRLQGRAHEVFTGVAVCKDGSVVSMVDVTEVAMLPMTDEEIADYVDTGEPMDKAGAYAIQGRGGEFVASVSGSPFTVVGLPLHLLGRLMRSVGADPDQFRRRSKL